YRAGGLRHRDRRYADHGPRVTGLRRRTPHRARLHSFKNAASPVCGGRSEDVTSVTLVAAPLDHEGMLRSLQLYQGPFTTSVSDWAEATFSAKASMSLSL